MIQTHYKPLLVCKIFNNYDALSVRLYRRLISINFMDLHKEIATFIFN